MIRFRPVIDLCCARNTICPTTSQSKCQPFYVPWWPAICGRSYLNLSQPFQSTFLLCSSKFVLSKLTSPLLYTCQFGCLQYYTRLIFWPSEVCLLTQSLLRYEVQPPLPEPLQGESVLLSIRRMAERCNISPMINKVHVFYILLSFYWEPHPPKKQSSKMTHKSA